MLARMWRKGNHFALLVGLQTDATTLRNSIEVSQKVKNRTTLRPRSCTTRYYPKDTKMLMRRGYVHPNVYRSAINDSQIMERAQMSID